MSTDDSRFRTQAVHDLASALWFGGAVMGVAGVNKSGVDLDTGITKVRVASSAWSRFAPVEWIGVGAVLLTGAQLTRAGGGRTSLQRGWAQAGRAKGWIVVAGAAATAFATYSGQRIARLSEGAARAGTPFDVQDASLPNAGTPPEIARWQQPHRLVQYAVPALAGANIVLNAHLVQQRRGAALGGLATSVLRR